MSAPATLVFTAANLLKSMLYNNFPLQSVKVSKGAKIKNRYNQVTHLTQDTNGKVTTSQLDITNESQEVDFSLPDDNDDLYSALSEAIVNFNWDIIRDLRKWLEQKYGMRAKIKLAFKTAYFKTFEDFSNVLDEGLGICVELS